MKTNTSSIKILSGLLLLSITSSCSSLVTGAKKAKDIDCKNEKSLTSIESRSKKILTFKNRSKEEVKIYWIDFDGFRKLYTTLPQNKTIDQITYASHPWVITDEADQCLRLLPNATPENEVFDIEGR